MPVYHTLQYAKITHSTYFTSQATTYEQLWTTSTPFKAPLKFKQYIHYHPAHICQGLFGSRHCTIPNTHSRVLVMRVCEALAIYVPRRKLSALVLYSHEDTDKIVHPRGRSIAIRRMTKGHLPSDVRIRWDDGSVK